MCAEACDSDFGAIISLALAALAIYLLYKLLPYISGGLFGLLGVCVAWIIPDFIIHSFCHSTVWLYVFGIVVYALRSIFVTSILLSVLYSIGETDRFPYPGVFRTVLGIILALVAELIAIAFCSSLIHECRLYSGALSVVLMITAAAATIITALRVRSVGMNLWWDEVWWDEVKKKDDSINTID